MTAVCAGAHAHEHERRRRVMWLLAMARIAACPCARLSRRSSPPSCSCSALSTVPSHSRTGGGGGGGCGLVERVSIALVCPLPSNLTHRHWFELHGGREVSSWAHLRPPSPPTHTHTHTHTRPLLFGYICLWHSLLSPRFFALCVGCAPTPLFPVSIAAACLLSVVRPPPTPCSSVEGGREGKAPRVFLCL